jgi:glycopeptide antibiotics resistance protein
MVAIWMLVALALLLAPAPREWGAFGKWVSPYYDDVQPVLQPGAHLVLMTVCTVLLMRLFVHRTLWTAVVYSFVLAGMLTIALELLQSTLPIAFARTSDIEDLGPSLAGAALGCFVGVRTRNREKKPC